MELNGTARCSARRRRTLCIGSLCAIATQNLCNYFQFQLKRKFHRAPIDYEIITKTKFQKINKRWQWQCNDISHLNCFFSLSNFETTRKKNTVSLRDWFGSLSRYSSRWMLWAYQYQYQNVYKARYASFGANGTKTRLNVPFKFNNEIMVQKICQFIRRSNLSRKKNNHQQFGMGTWRPKKKSGKSEHGSDSKLVHSKFVRCKAAADWIKCMCKQQFSTTRLSSEHSTPHTKGTATTKTQNRCKSFAVCRLILAEYFCATKQARECWKWENALWQLTFRCANSIGSDSSLTD